MLTGWDIDIMTEAEESERRTREFNERTALFKNALEVDEVLAQLLVTEGFTQVEDISASTTEDIAGIEGLDEDIAGELKSRADAWLAAEAEKADKKRKELGVSDEVAGLPGLKPAQIVTLGEKGIKTLDDVADLAGDELIEALGAGSLSLEQANAIVMAARAHWFTDDASGGKPGAAA
jgi:N utilization substance protein A